LVLKVLQPQRLLNSPFGALHILLLGLTGTLISSSFNISFQRVGFIQQLKKKCVKSSVFQMSVA